jgi:hypothetical protein
MAGARVSRGRPHPITPVRTVTCVPGVRGVSNLARRPATKTLMWRRMRGVESHSRSRIPGQQASRASKASLTVAADNSTRWTEPGNRLTSAAGSVTTTRGKVFYASTTSVSTEQIGGKCCAMQFQLSPSSALANRVPVFVPK